MKKKYNRKNKSNKYKSKLINKKMTFSEILKKNPNAIEMLSKEGMHCFGCSMASQETLEQGAFMHGLNPDELVEKINKKIKIK